MVNLWNHHVPVNGYCPVCQEEVETTDHAMFWCSRAREIWELILPSMIEYHWSQMDIKDQWLSFRGRQGDKLKLICRGAWAIWNDRNNLIHNRPAPNPTTRCEWIREYMADFRKVNPLGGSNFQSVEDVHRLIAEGEGMIMHTDAAYRGDKNTIGIGLVVRDKQGNLKAVKNMSSQVCTSPLGAEAAAVLEGLRLARALDVHHLTIMSNSLSLINSIEEEIQCEFCIATTLWDIKAIQNSFVKVTFGYVSRRFNRFSHKMAQAGLYSQSHLW